MPSAASSIAFWGAQAASLRRRAALPGAVWITAWPFGIENFRSFAASCRKLQAGSLRSPEASEMTLQLCARARWAYFAFGKQFPKRKLPRSLPI
jgi:hypothetical protein